MNVQAAPPPFAAMDTGRAPAGNPPVLGQQIPGHSGGLPAQGGLSVTANPMAEQLRSFGRGDDSMLVHMTPAEVNSLQGLAMAHGGSLTINPHTGLPEAGWLGKLLPTLLGGVLAATGVGAPLAAGIVGLGQTAITGDLKKGLMAGLGAFGGASLAGAAGLGGAISKNAFGALGSKAGIFGANMGAGIAAPTGGTLLGTDVAADSLAKGALNTIPDQAAAAVGKTAALGAKTGVGGVIQKFGQTAAQGLPGGIISKAAPLLAAQGLMSGVSGALTPSGGGTQTVTGQIDNSYQGPYFAQDRQRIEDPNGPLTSKQRRHFAVSMPEIYNTAGQLVQPGSMTVQGTPILQPVARSNPKKGENMYDFRYVPYMGGVAPTPAVQQAVPGALGGMDGFDPNNTGYYAKGGDVHMRDGAFVVDARTVSELGNGSSNAGMELLSRMGGHPVRGPGDGVSDSVPAKIGGKQEARVARDEVIFQPEAVKRIGGGSEKRGTQKLYALMDKAHKARKNAKRGQDTGVRRGLAV